MTTDKKPVLTPFVESTAKKHWRDMPEFVQEEMKPFHAVIVRFQTQEAIDAFAKLVDQNIGPNTKSIWYPKVEMQKSRKDRKYVDADSE